VDALKVWEILKNGGLEAVLFLLLLLMGKLYWEKDKQVKKLMERFIDLTVKQTEATGKLTGTVNTMKAIVQILASRTKK